MTGLAGLAAGVLAGLGAAMACPAGMRSADRLLAALPVVAAPAAAGAAASSRDGGLPARRRRRHLAAGVVLVAGPVVIGGPVGLVAGLAAAAAVAVVRPGRDGSGVDPDGVAVVVDLIAGCLAAGAGMPAALDAAAAVPGEALRRSCRAVAEALRSGIPADEAWQSWLPDPWLAPVARTAMRTSQTGAAAAADLRRTSARLRARRRSMAQHKVRQASVWLVVPLGLCFLPAFVLVAVVPLVVGLLPSLR